MLLVHIHDIDHVKDGNTNSSYQLFVFDLSVLNYP